MIEAHRIRYNPAIAFEFFSFIDLSEVIEKLNEITFPLKSRLNKRCGMYGETPRLTIEGLAICLMSPDRSNKSVWINDDNTGGEFLIEKLTLPLREFYNKNC